MTAPNGHHEDSSRFRFNQVDTAHAPLSSKWEHRFKWLGRIVLAGGVLGGLGALIGFGWTARSHLDGYASAQEVKALAKQVSDQSVAMDEIRTAHKAEADHLDRMEQAISESRRTVNDIYQLLLRRK